MSYPVSKTPFHEMGVRVYVNYVQVRQYTEAYGGITRRILESRRVYNGIQLDSFMSNSTNDTEFEVFNEDDEVMFTYHNETAWAVWYRNPPRQQKTLRDYFTD